MFTDTKTEKTLTWRDYATDLRERLHELMSTPPDSGSWFSPHAESINRGYYYYGGLTPGYPPPGQVPWTETWKSQPLNPSIIEELYAPSRSIKHWLMWQQALRDQEEMMERMQRELVVSMRRRWDYQSGDTTWEQQYHLTRRGLLQ